MIQSIFNLLPAGMQGVAEYYLRPGSAIGFSGPLNGQTHRQLMFNQIVTAIKPAGIIETGTFRGTTTQYMSEQAHVPVWSAEANRRFYAFAIRRLAKFPDVKVILSDSRGFLKQLSTDPSVPKKNVFFYLDAHWHDDLPLKDEVQIIMKSWKQVAIMVDDFKVNDDPAYTYDDYGAGKCLELDYIGKLSDYGLNAYFPSLPGEKENNNRRGSVVLMDDAAAAIAGNVSSIRRYNG